MTLHRLMAAYIILVGLWLERPLLSIVPAWLASLSAKGSVTSFYLAPAFLFEAALAAGLVAVGIVMLVRASRTPPPP